jgi:hypothetical protein
LLLLYPLLPLPLCLSCDHPPLTSLLSITLLVAALSPRGSDAQISPWRRGKGIRQRNSRRRQIEREGKLQGYRPYSIMI